jgi:hypothetical protein
MKIVNVHERVLDASVDRVGQLIGGLPSDDDRRRRSLPAPCAPQSLIIPQSGPKTAIDMVRH